MFMLIAPAVLHINIFITEQHFNFADLHAVVDPAFDLADPVNIGIVEQPMTAVCPLRFQQSVTPLPRA